MMKREEIVRIAEEFEIDGMSLLPYEVQRIADEVLENYDEEIWDNVEEYVREEVDLLATLTIYPED